VLAERLQVSAAVGAFLVGIALSGEVAEGAQALISPLRDLFAAVFFVFFGLNTDPAQIPPVLLPAVILAVITAATKIATGYWATRRAGIGVSVCGDSAADPAVLPLLIGLGIRALSVGAARVPLVAGWVAQVSASGAAAGTGES